MKTVNIKGKPYVEVNERVKYFREEYPNARLITELISNMQNQEGKGVCIFKANVLDENNNIISTGHAYEKEDSTFINKTSYIENCETSAIGRALGMLGIGIDTSIASAEEVENAVLNQEQVQTGKQKQNTQPITKDEMYEVVKEAVKEDLMKTEEVTESLRQFNKTRFVDLTYTQAKIIYDVAKKRLEARG